MALNHIVIMGRLTSDPSLRRTGSGTAVASFTIAVDDDYKDDQGNRKTIFVDCVAWRGLGETVAKYFTKGRMAVVSGKLDIRSWTDKDGNKRRTAEVVADHCYFGDSNPQGNQSNQNGYSAPAPGYGAPAGNYGTGGQYGGYGGGYAAPAGGDQYSANNFDMLEGEDGNLPF